MKIEPGNYVKLNNGVIALVTQDEKLIHIETGAIVSTLKKYNDQLMNASLNEIGENGFDIEEIYEDMTLKKIIYKAVRYNKELVKELINQKLIYLCKRDNLYLSKEKPTVIVNSSNPSEKLIVFEKDTLLYEINFLSNLLPDIEQNTFIDLTELEPKEKKYVIE